MIGVVSQAQLDYAAYRVNDREKYQSANIGWSCGIRSNWTVFSGASFVFHWF
jgi:hypothetical protein